MKRQRCLIKRHEVIPTPQEVLIAVSENASRDLARVLVQLKLVGYLLAGVAIGPKVVQPAPWQRSTR